MSTGGLARRVVMLVSLVVSLAAVAAIEPEDTAKPGRGRSLQ
jgi:hypothetical protein